MASLNKNIYIDQGTTFSQSFTIKDSNGDALSTNAWSSNCSFKRHYGSTNSYSLTSNINSNGLITISCTANASSNYASGMYYYDIKLTNANNEIIRFQEGFLTIRPKIT